MNYEDIVTCPTHGLKFNNKQFKMCYKCHFRKCETCGKYRLKSNSEYKSCYDCYLKKKQVKEVLNNIDNKIKEKKSKINSIFEYKD